MLTFIFLLLVGCHKEPIVTPYPPTPCLFGLCDTSKLEVIWQRPLSFDTTELISEIPISWNNKVLFSRSTFNQIDTLKCFDTKTGQLLWNWADYLFGRKSASTHTGIEFLQNSKFLFTTWNDVYCLDAQDGHTVWRSKLESGEGFPRIKGIDDYIYHVQKLPEIIPAVNE